MGGLLSNVFLLTMKRNPGKKNRLVARKERGLSDKEKLMENSEGWQSSKVRVPLYGELSVSCLHVS